jgi:hypothetical protein
MLGNSSADFRQRPREFHHVLVFCALADRAELRMVAILFASLGVTAGRLDVTVRARANPDVRIGGRDCKLADSPERGLVVHRLAIRFHECEAPAGPLAPNAGLLIGDKAQPCGLAGVARIDN